MHRARKLHAVFTQIFKHFWKNIFLIFSINILITRNDPFCPALGSFRSHIPLDSRKVQAPCKTVLPRRKGTRKIGHCAPYSDDISITVFFRQMLYLVKMGICVFPKPLYKSLSAVRRAFFSYNGEGFLNAFFPFHNILRYFSNSAFSA